MKKNLRAGDVAGGRVLSGTHTDLDLISSYAETRPAGDPTWGRGRRQEDQKFKVSLAT